MEVEHGWMQVDACLRFHQRYRPRWDAAYAPIRSTTEASIPADLRAAIDDMRHYLRKMHGREWPAVTLSR